jgi:hypothetical protein
VKPNNFNPDEVSMAPPGVPATPAKIGWKTIVGGIIVAVAPLVEQVVPGITETIQAIFTAVGGIIGIIGLRQAVSKNGRGV